MSHPCHRLLGRVRVIGAHVSKVAGVDGLRQVERPRAAHLADQNAVRPASQGRPQKIALATARNMGLPDQAVPARRASDRTKFGLSIAMSSVSSITTTVSGGSLGGKTARSCIPASVGRSVSSPSSRQSIRRLELQTGPEMTTSVEM